MGSLAEYFNLNREIILFVYGLVFFILGFAIILQARQSSRLDLARSLRWLAAFGILHAFNEWGDLFIPIQATYLDPVSVKILYVIQLLLLAASFACLFQFGVALLHPLGRARWLHGFAAGLLVVWVFVIFFMILPFIPDELVWYQVANALARYLIGFPGGMLAAYALRTHTMQRIKPLNVPVIVGMLRIAGVSLGVYAILAGLIPPPVGFFPGNFLNTRTFELAVGIPPLVFRSLVSLIIAAAVIRALEVFDLETQRRIEALEQQQIINAEHERLARELHDGAIQKVYTAGLLVDSAARLAKPESELGTRLERALVVLNDAIADLRHNLAGLHTETQAPPGQSLRQLLEQLAHDPHYNSLVDISLESDLPEDGMLSASRTGHVYAILNEALANIVRHARARHVRIQGHATETGIQFVIKDDGIGLAPEAPAGYGLRNMRDRARLLNGRIDFSSPAGKGTQVMLDIPWVD